MKVDRELWVYQGIFGWSYVSIFGWKYVSLLGWKYVSILSEAQDPLSPVQESLSNLLKVVAQKRRSRPEVMRTVVVDEEDFQSVSFLQGGSRKANAVCRIAREFSLVEFKNFIRTIQSSDTFNTQSFDSIAKIKEIFSIPDEMSDRLFELADSNEPQPPLAALLHNITDSDLAKLNPVPLGTGFLVGENHLLTNHHVVQSASLAEQCIAQFNYVENEAGITQQSDDYRLDPRALFITNPSLDYTLVQLAASPLRQQAGYEFGWIQLIENEADIVPGLVWLEQKEHTVSEQDPSQTVSEPNSQRAVSGQDSQRAVSGQDSQQKIQKSIRRHVELLERLDRILESAEGQDEYRIEPGQTLGDRSIIVIRAPLGEENRNIQYLKAKSPKLEELLEDEDYKGIYTLEEESGEPVYLVQHPKGRQKQVVLTDNKVINDGLFRDFLRYRADSDYGSSGCPVFNSRWQLVALHHAAIRPLSDPTKVTSQQGIRIHSIIKDLKRRQFEQPQLRRFVENYVVTAEQLNYPPLPSGLEFDGVSSYVQAEVGIEGQELAAAEIITADVGGTIKFWRRNGLEVGSLETFRMGVGPFHSFHFLRDQLSWIAGEPNQVYITGKEPIIPIALNTKAFYSKVIVFFRNRDVAIGARDRDVAIWAIATSNPERLSLRCSRLILYKFLIQAEQISTLEIDRTIEFESNITGLYSSEGVGLWLIVALENGIIEFLRLDGKRERQTLIGHKTAIKSISSEQIQYTANGQFPVKYWDVLASASEDGMIKVWVLVNYQWKTIPALNAFHEGVNCIKLFPYVDRSSADDSYRKLFLVSAGRDGSLFHREIQIDNGGEAGRWLTDSPAPLQSHPNAINHLLFKHIGEILVSTSIDGLVKIWKWDQKAKTLVPTNSFTHNGLISDIQFQPGSSVSPPEFIWPIIIGDNTMLTLEAWINPHLNSTSGIIISLFIGNQGGFILSIANEGQLLYTVFSGGKRDEWRSRSLLPSGQFSHIAVVYESKEGSSEQAINFYINGQKDSAIKQSEFADTLVMNPSRKSALLIGAKASDQDAGETGFFKGVITEVRVWNKSRSLAEIQQKIFSRLTENQEGLVGYWRFEEGSGNRIYNLAATDESYGTAYGTKRVATYSPPLPMPFGMEFNGIDQILQVKHSHPFEVRLSKSSQVSTNVNNADEEIKHWSEGITVEAWVKHQFGNGYILSQSSHGKKKEYSLQWYEGKLRMTLGEKVKNSKRSVQKDVFDTHDRLPNDSAWHHVAFTWSAQNREVEIYVDGVRQNIIAVQGEARSILMGGLYKSVGLFEGPITIHPETYLTIGGFYTGAESSGEESSKSRATSNKASKDEEKDTFFDGAIAEVRIWNTSRTQNQIRSTLYNRILNPQKQPDLLGYWRLDETIEIDGRVKVRDRSQFEKHMEVPAHSEPQSKNKTEEHENVSTPTWFPISTHVPIDILQEPAAELIQQALDRNLLADLWSAGVIGGDPRFKPDQAITKEEYNAAIDNVVSGINPIESDEEQVTRERAIAHLVEQLDLKVVQMTKSEVDGVLAELYQDANDIDQQEEIAIATVRRMIVRPAAQGDPQKDQGEPTKGAPVNSVAAGNAADLRDDRADSNNDDAPAQETQILFNPKMPLTRGEFAALLSRTLVAIGQAPDAPSTAIVEPPKSDESSTDAKSDDESPPQEPEEDIVAEKLERLFIPEDYWAIRFLRALADRDEQVKKYLTDEDFAPHTVVPSEEYAGVVQRILGITLELTENSSINRVQAIAQLANALELSGGSADTLSVYRDHDQIPEADRNAITAATVNRLVVAYPEVQDFQPNNELTRAELVAIVYQGWVAQKQAAQESVEEIDSSFIVAPPIPPAPVKHWASDFVAGLQNLAVEFTNTGEAFTPHNAVSFDDYAALVQRVLGITLEPSDSSSITRLRAIAQLANALQLTGGDANTLTVYRDHDQIPETDRAAIAAATANRLVVSYPDVRDFRPNDELTRAELAAIVYQGWVAQKQAGQEAIEEIDSPFIVSLLELPQPPEPPLLPEPPPSPAPPQPPVPSHWTADFVAGLQNLGIEFFQTTTAETWETAATLQQLDQVFQQAFQAPLNIGNSADAQKPITRLLAIIVFAKKLGLADQDPALTNLYVDRGQIITANHQFLPALAAATQQGFVVNYPVPNQLRPNARLTQAEMGVLIYQALVSRGRASGLQSDYIVYPDLPAYFTDIAGHWAEPLLQVMGDRRWLGGFPNGTAKPDENITRAQYAALLVKVLDAAPQRLAIDFVDLPQDPKHPDYWVREPITKAYQSKLMDGISSNRFNYSANITRAEVMVSLGKIIAAPPASIPNAAHAASLNAAQMSAILSAYTDANALPDWAKREGAKQNIAIAAQSNLVVNPPDIAQNQLHPHRLATRAEVVAMLYRASIHLGLIEPITAEFTFDF